jgi:hypothetical protein
MVSRKAFIPLLRSLLSLLLTGLFLVGGTAGYCITRLELNSKTVNAKEADRIEKPSRQAAAEVASVHIPSLKLPILFCFVPGQPCLPVEKGSVLIYGCLKPADRYLFCILRNFIVRNAP